MHYMYLTPSIFWSSHRPRRGRHNAGHGVGIDEHAVAQGVGALGALDLEAEFPVKADGGGIVDEDVEFEPPQPEPFVGDIDQGRKQRPADAVAVPVVMHAHADATGMGAAALENVQPGIADYGASEFGDKADSARLRFFQRGSRRLGRGKRRAQRAVAKAWQVGQRIQAIGIADARGADDEIGGCGVTRHGQSFKDAFGCLYNTRYDAANSNILSS